MTTMRRPAVFLSIANALRIIFDGSMVIFQRVVLFVLDLIGCNLSSWGSTIVVTYRELNFVVLN